MICFFFSLIDLQQHRSYNRYHNNFRAVDREKKPKKKKQNKIIQTISMKDEDGRY